MPDFGGTYETGTISVANGSTTVTGTGVLWSDFTDGLDALLAGGSIGLVESVNAGFNVITLATPWAGGTLVDAPYVLLKSSPLRYDPALNQAKVRELLLKLDDAGVIYTVAGAAPDPGIGNDGDFAFKTSTLPYTLWLKVDGEWVEQAQWGPFVPKGTWSAIVTYLTGHLVQAGNYVFVSNVDANLNHPPDSATPASDAYWTWLPLPGTDAVLDALGIHAITVSEAFPSGGVDGDLWFKVPAA